MKKLSLTLFLALVCSFGFGQTNYADSVKKYTQNLSYAKNDTSRVLALKDLCMLFGTANPDSSLYFGQKSLNLARKINFPRGEASALNELGFTQIQLGNHSTAHKLFLNSLKVAEKNNLIYEKINAYHSIGNNYSKAKDFSNALIYLKKGKAGFQTLKTNDMYVISEKLIGAVFFQMNQLDSALYYTQLAYNDMLRYKNTTEWTKPFIFNSFANIYVKKGNLPLALSYLKQSAVIGNQMNNFLNNALTSNEIAKIYLQLNKSDSCIYFANKSLAFAQQIKNYQNVVNACNVLTQIYEKQDAQKALQYSQLALAAKDSLYNYEKTNALKNITDFDDQERKYEIETAQTEYQNKVKLYALLVGLAIFSLIAFILYRNNRQKQQTNALLQDKNEEIEKTLSKLKSTQNQLIQKEKLASLGELTAGIAHEIQNPLNFVNNFAELSVDLVKDLKEEIEKSVFDKEYLAELFSDLSQNQEKINLHGKRASSIVTGMLEHSRASTGERVLTDINKLADESLRLSYHGLRAKDKNFNSDFKTDFDNNLPRIKVIPQDIGRVLLNIINNAFYAVSKNAGRVQNHASVKVYTQQSDNQVIIKIKDNGTGMNEATKAKIFQPFFTTKPTGQGTGLGLSLAYDIITKGHGGTIECESVEGEGTTFIINLPI